MLCYIRSYSCCASQERINTFQFLWLLAFSSSLLTCTLPTMGSANCVRSRHNETTDAVNRISNAPAFSCSSFTLNKRPSSPSSLSSISVVSSAHLTLLIFLLTILIPACDSSYLAFCMMYSAYKLNKQGDNIQPVYFTYSFSNFEPVLSSMPISNCYLLTSIHVSQEIDKMV